MLQTKKHQVYLSIFFCLEDSQSGAFGRDEVNPIVVTNEYFKRKKLSLLECFFCLLDSQSGAFWRDAVNPIVVANEYLKTEKTPNLSVRFF